MARRTATTPTTPGSLVAAATRLRIERSMTGTTTAEQWQAGMWQIYDETPEVHYGLNFKRAAASKMRYFAAEWSDDPLAEPEATENPRVVEAFDMLNNGQGVEDMFGEALIHLDVAGELYVIGRETDQSDSLEWAAWSPLEAAADQPLQEQIRTGQAIAYRVWRAHPRNGKQADSPLRAARDVADELWALSSLGRAQARSRIPAKILVLAQDLKIQQDDSDPNPNDSIADDLGQLLIRPILDPSSAGAVVPVIIEAPRDMVAEGAGWAVIDITRDLADLSAREERLIRRLAAGLDLPAEIILGMAEMNHWSAWLVDEASVKTHVDPAVRLVLDGLTRAYLHPTLQEMGVPDWERYVLWRDYSSLVQHPDRSTSSLELYDRAELRGETLRQVHGFGPEDEPTPEEREIILENLGKAASVEDEDVDGGNVVEVMPMPPPALVASDAPAPITLTDLAGIDSATFDQLTEAIEAAIQKAMERAGSRIRNQTRKDRVVSASIDGVDNRRVALTVGQRTAFQLVPEDDLVTPDDFGQLREQAARILQRGQSRVRSALGHLNVDPPTETESAGWLRRAVEYVAAAALGLTLRRLFTAAADPDPLDGEASDVAVPAVDVWATLTIAGGGTPETFQPDTPRGIGLGPDTRQRLAQDGYQTVRYEWSYGDASSRRTNFPPHEALDGFQFASWTDERLTSYTSWLSVTHYYPGDHRGCRCQAVPVVVQPASER